MTAAEFTGKSPPYYSIKADKKRRKAGIYIC